VQVHGFGSSIVRPKNPICRSSVSGRPIHAGRALAQLDGRFADPARAAAQAQGVSSAMSEAVLCSITRGAQAARPRLRMVRRALPAPCPHKLADGTGSPAPLSAPKHAPDMRPTPVAMPSPFKPPLPTCRSAQSLPAARLRQGLGRVCRRERG